MKTLIVVLLLAACAYGQSDNSNPHEKRIAFLESHLAQVNALLDRGIVLLEQREAEIRSLKSELVRVQVAPVSVPCVPTMADRINAADAWGRIGAGVMRRPLLSSPSILQPGVQPLFRQTICTPIGTGLNCTTY